MRRRHLGSKQFINDHYYAPPGCNCLAQWRRVAATLGEWPSDSIATIASYCRWRWSKLCNKTRDLDSWRRANTCWATACCTSLTHLEEPGRGDVIVPSDLIEE